MEDISKTPDRAIDHQPDGSPDGADRPAFRLSPREWCVAIGLWIGICLVLPRIAKLLEPVDLAATPRQPYELSRDDWLFERRAEAAVSEGAIVVLGDSVVHGEYVAPDETLASDLARAAGERFENLGVNGLHPLALEGLVRYHGRALRDARVIVWWNPLWSSSPERDLSVETSRPFNHERLVPQFWPPIPAYDAGFEERIRTALERRLDVWLWATHVELTRYDGLDFPSWSLEHPRTFPFAPLSSPPRPLVESSRHEPIPWDARGITISDPPWVELDASVQWAAFTRTVELLAKRGNAVFVILGDLNEHALASASRERLARIRAEARSRLEASGLSSRAAPPLPSELWADLSHPLAAGYAVIARDMVESAAFRRFLAE